MSCRRHLDPVYPLLYLSSESLTVDSIKVVVVVVVHVTQCDRPGRLLWLFSGWRSRALLVRSKVATAENAS
jgi:hypothetical protein